MKVIGEVASGTDKESSVATKRPATGAEIDKCRINRNRKIVGGDPTTPLV